MFGISKNLEAELIKIIEASIAEREANVCSA